MSLRPIITVPNEILRKISEPVQKIGINEKKLIKDLFETMYNAKGIPKQIVVLDVSKENEKKKPYCLINPRIKKFSKDTSKYEEGCLSIPDTFIEIERPKEIYLEYIDENGKKKEIKCDGLLSTCIQHEIQHCEGKLIIDFLSKLKKDFIIKKIIKKKSSSDKIIV